MFGLAGHGLGKGGGLPWLQQTIPGDASRHSRKAHRWGWAQGRQQVNPPSVASPLGCLGPNPENQALWMGRMVLAGLSKQMKHQPKKVPPTLREE